MLIEGENLNSQGNKIARLEELSKQNLTNVCVVSK